VKYLAVSNQEIGKGDKANKQIEDPGSFGPAIRIIVVIVLMKSLPALHTQAPVHQTAPKVRRNVGSICDNSHGNATDMVA